MSAEPRRRATLSLPGKPRVVLLGLPARALEPPAWPPKLHFGLAYYERKRAELAEILGAEPPAILSGRRPAPLAIGTRDALLTRYPAADPIAVGRWLASWTSTEQYLRAAIAGGPRFDLDGRVAGEVAPDQAEWARTTLKRRARKATEEQ